MKLLNDLKNDLLDSNLSLSTALRRALVIANDLNNEEFKKWVLNELNGYNNVIDIPDYRKGRAEVYGDFMNNQGILKNYQIQLGSLSDRAGIDINQKNLNEGVKALESMVETDKSPVFAEYWPANLLATVANSLIVDFTCLRAWWLIPRGRIEQVLDLIRNKLLSFVIELQKQVPNDNDEDSLAKIPKETTSTIINTFILGDKNVVGSGQNITINLSKVVKKNNLKSLKDYLKKVIEIPEKEIAELEKSIKEDGYAMPKDSFGKKVSKWLGNLSQKLYEGAISAGIKNAPLIMTQVTEAISKYYGI